MVVNLFKQLFWCGVFHKTNLCMDLAYPNDPITEKDIGQIAVCSVCGTSYEVV